MNLRYVAGVLALGTVIARMVPDVTKEDDPCAGNTQPEHGYGGHAYERQHL